MSKRSQDVNKGIVADQVTSYGPMAVGDHAQAVQTGTSFHREPFIEGLTALRDAVNGAKLSGQVKSKMIAEIDALDSEAKETRPDTARLKNRLQRAAKLVKSVHEIFGDTAGLIEPLQKLAGVVGLIV